MCGSHISLQFIHSNTHVLNGNTDLGPLKHVITIPITLAKHINKNNGAIIGMKIRQTITESFKIMFFTVNTWKLIVPNIKLSTKNSTGIKNLKTKKT